MLVIRPLFFRGWRNWGQINRERNSSIVREDGL
jgi:hypothetical protein